MKAVFLDRDGVINELVYHQELGIIDSPFTADQFNLRPGVAAAISQFHELGYQVVVVSNQPGIAKGHFTAATFAQIVCKMTQELARASASVDGEYYCLHHPEARLPGYRMECDCRKPAPGLITRAAREMKLDLSRSWMIGDGLTDVQAGKLAGVSTILIGTMKCELCKLMDEKNARPDAVCSDLLDAARLIRNHQAAAGGAAATKDNGVMFEGAACHGAPLLTPAPARKDANP